MSFAAQVRRRAAGRRRVPLEQLWQALADDDPVAARSLDARARLAALVDAGHRAGHWEPARSSDDAGEPPLPRFVTLPPRDDPAPARAVAWRPELAFADDLSPTDAQREVLVAVNRWLARTVGHDLPVVPQAERSLEVFGNEKLIGRRRGGATLWRPGRLDAKLLRFEREAPLILWEPAGNGRALLVVENQATFLSAVRVMREHGGRRYGAVAWGEGGQGPGRVVTAARTGMDRIEYFGDLDADGIRIAAATDVAARKAGLGPVAPATALYELLLEHGRPQATQSTQVDLAWLPASLRQRAAAVLAGGHRLAQEAVGYQVLVANAHQWASAVP